MIYIENVRITGGGRPIRTLSLSFKFRWAGKAALVAVVESTLSCKEQSLVVPFQLAGFPRLFKKEETVHSTVVLPVSDAAIKFIEEQRNGGDAVLDTVVKFHCQDINPAEPVSFSVYIELCSSGAYNPADFKIVIPRSEWLRTLRQLDWSETKLFEIDAKAFRQDTHLAKALEELGQAETLFREGEYDEMLSACSNSFTALSSVRIAGTQESGVDAILARCFRDESKREHVKAAIESIHRFCQLGARETYPALPFSRAEAEYCLSTTLTVFSLLGHRLAEGTGLRVKE